MSQRSKKKSAAAPTEKNGQDAGRAKETFGVQVLALAKGSVFCQVGLMMPHILKAIPARAKQTSDDDILDSCADFADVANANKENESEAMANMLHLGDAVSAAAPPPSKKSPDSVKEGAASAFKIMTTRLSIKNPLGLFTTDDESMRSFSDMMKLEFDGGPRSKKRGNPVGDRLLANILSHFLQYFHILWAYMVVRAFLFRSFFACLPWLLFYQMLSVMLPLSKTNQVPLPLEAIPIDIRTAAAFFLHSLMWLFSVYEFVACAWWLEWFLAAAAVSGHAYAFRPSES